MDDSNEDVFALSSTVEFESPVVPGDGDTPIPISIAAGAGASTASASASASAVATFSVQSKPNLSRAW